MTITLTREEAQQVLDAIVLSMPMFAGHNKQHAAAIETLRARLAQPEPEPVAWFSKRPDNTLAIKIVGKPTEGDWEPLYTAPPQAEPEPQGVIAKWIKTNTEHRGWYICPKCSHQTPRFKDEWQGLTDEEVMLLVKTWHGSLTLASAIEAKLKEKNGA
jgi:hypothetical protein